MTNDITINKSILHVLDTNASIPVLSDALLNMNQTVSEFIEKHVNKSVKDPGVKRTSFRVGSPFKRRIQNYQSNPHELVRISSEISQLFFDYMVENIEIPSADLLFVDFHLNHENFLGILKFNYKQGYIHYVNTDNQSINDIILQQCVLPSGGQKLDEFILINLTNSTMEEILLKEKKYLINNEKEFYISSQLLLCEPALSEKEAFEIVEKTVNEIIRKEYNGDHEKTNMAKTVIVDDFITDSEIDIENIASVVFDGDETVQERFMERLEQRGLFEKKFQITSTIENKICGKQKFITDTGIEIYIPSDQLKRRDIIEFVNNPDGTISVEIKKIGLLNHK